MIIGTPSIIKYVKKKIFMSCKVTDYYDMYPIVPPNGKFFYQHQKEYNIGDIVICTKKRSNRVIIDTFPALFITSKTPDKSLYAYFRYTVNDNLGIYYNNDYLKVYAKLTKVIDPNGKIYNY